MAPLEPYLAITFLLIFYRSHISKETPKMKRIIITVVGEDKVGITAKITGVIAECNVNILDINQTLLQDIFTMVMLCDIQDCNCDFDIFQQKLDDVARELAMKIHAQKEEIFSYMHRI